MMACPTELWGALENIKPLSDGLQCKGGKGFEVLNLQIMRRLQQAIIVRRAIQFVFFPWGDAGHEIQIQKLYDRMGNCHSWIVFGTKKPPKKMMLTKRLTSFNEVPKPARMFRDSAYLNPGLVGLCLFLDDLDWGIASPNDIHKCGDCAGYLTPDAFLYLAGILLPLTLSDPRSFLEVEFVDTFFYIASGEKHRGMFANFSEDQISEFGSSLEKLRAIAERFPDSSWA